MIMYLINVDGYKITWVRRQCLWLFFYDPNDQVQVGNFVNLSLKAIGILVSKIKFKVTAIPSLPLQVHIYEFVFNSYHCPHWIVICDLHHHPPTVILGQRLYVLS